MKRILISMLLVFFSLLAFSQKKVSLQPVIKKQTVKIISGNQNFYYALNTVNSVEFDVQAYDKIVIYSREEINKKALGYSISYNFDNNLKQQYVVGEKRKDYKSAYSDKSISRDVSLFYKKEISIPKQAKSIYFKSLNSKSVDIKIGGFISEKRTFLKPLNQHVNRVRIAKGKTYNYYKLNSKIPTIIETDKEGELIVYTRKRMSNKSSNKYSFSYQIQDVDAEKINIVNVQASTQAVYSSLNIKQTPSTYNKTVINVGDVYQKIFFSSDFPVDARFIFKKTIKKEGWEELESKQSKVVPLIVKKKKVVREYTRIQANSPFNFSIDNAKEIKVFIRGEFQYDMHANNDYEIILKDNNKVVNTYKLSCHRSNVMQYKYNDELIPGTLDKFSIEVPKGKHNYSIAIKNKDKTALVRVLKKM